MPTTDLLKTFGLSRNPFTDRTAEKSSLDSTSLYIHSDLRGLAPSETTYVFFGRRGSGKTTIRLLLEEGYRAHNEQALLAGVTRGHFIVDLCRPGHMTACLATFQEVLNSSVDNWDAAFSQQWRTSDMVDCMLSYAATELMRRFGTPGEESRAMLLSMTADPLTARQFLLLVHLYARTDAGSLAAARRLLLRPRFSAVQVTVAVAAALTVTSGVVVAASDERVGQAVHEHVDAATTRLDHAFPLVGQHPRLVGSLVAGLALGGAVTYHHWQRNRAIERAAALQRCVRVVAAQPVETLARLLGSLFSTQDSADTVRTLAVGNSAHQKLDLLQNLLRGFGFESVAVFGDCFDEVTLLDPVRFPAAIKAFAREVCRNDILNFGRLHFFFPDSRLALDLNTDRTLKEARFDRHFVRDLTWSRHQLEELAERRFRAAQEALREEEEAEAASHEAEAAGGPPAKATAGKKGKKSTRGTAAGELPSATNFADLFKKVRGEDFSSYIGKLATPRELMIMMTEMFGRIEANPEGGLTAQDMEIAVTKAMEQSV